MKRDRVALILIMSALAGMLLALSLPAHAQESAAPIVEAASVPAWVPTLAGALGAVVSIAMRIVDSWFSAALWRPIVVVLLTAVAVAAPLLARPLDALVAFVAFIGANQAAFGAWRLAAKAKQTGP